MACLFGALRQRVRLSATASQQCLFHACSLESAKDFTELYLRRYCATFSQKKSVISPIPCLTWPYFIVLLTQFLFFCTIKIPVGAAIGYGVGGILSEIIGIFITIARRTSSFYFLDEHFLDDVHINLSRIYRMETNICADWNFWTYLRSYLFHERARSWTT